MNRPGTSGGTNAPPQVGQVKALKIAYKISYPN